MATATAGPASPPDLARQDVRVVMAGLLTLVLLAALDQTVMATALPRIAKQLHHGKVTWWRDRRSDNAEVSAEAELTQ